MNMSKPNVIRINKETVVVDGVKYKRSEDDTLMGAYIELLWKHKYFNDHKEPIHSLNYTLKEESPSAFFIHLPHSNTEWYFVLSETLIKLREETSLPVLVQVLHRDFSDKGRWNLLVRTSKHRAPLKS